MFQFVTIQKQDKVTEYNFRNDGKFDGNLMANVKINKRLPTFFALAPSL